MRLISVIVRNYRLHGEIAIELDPQRTLIGGPNESGKSTLAEAIHRTLFFPAKSSAEPQKRMRSSVHAGHPEVEVVFEASGRRHHVRKRFSGASGTTTLTPARGAPLQGEAAEAELARLLQVSPDANAKASTHHWAHLWVEQGKSGDDPAEHANAQRDALLARLQGLGGAGAMQSDLDSRVAAVFASELEKVFTQTGKPKAGTELHQAEQEHGDALAGREAVARRLLEQLQAALDYESAAEAIKVAGENLAALETERATLEAKRSRVEELGRKLEGDERAARDATKAHDDLAAAHEQIVNLQREVGKIEAEIAPDEAELTRLANAHEACRLQAAEAEQASQRAAADQRSARLVHDYTVACLSLLEKRAQRAESAARVEQGRGLEKELAEHRARLSRLPVIDARQVKALQKIEGGLAQAEAALAAMATGIDLLTADAAVSVGDSPLQPGQSRILEEETEVAIGTSVRLRIRPGGGTSLREAREAVAEQRKALREKLDAMGIASVSAGSETAARREDLARTIQAMESRLGDFKLEAEGGRLAGLNEACEALEAEIERRRAETPGLPDAAPDLAAAQDAVGEARKVLRMAEMADESRRVARETATRFLQTAGKDLDEKRRQLGSRQQKLADLRARLFVLADNHGDDAARKEKLSAARLARDSAVAALGDTHKALESLQPDLLNASWARVQRAITERGNARRAAEEKRLVAQTLLRRDGSTDPQADVAQAEARLQAAGERVASARAHAAAIKLLDQLFRDEQRALAEQFTRPLAEKISGYLQCLFGPGARAEIVLQDNSFSGLQLVRPVQGMGAVPFDGLSGGAREQLAAAVRLAMAEVLAAEHHGCLPIVFDDSFAYSDPVRVKTLQDMLDLAARRGLQVIILTCNPSDYAGLGARQVLLKPPAQAAGTGPATGPTPAAAG